MFSAIARVLGVSEDYLAGRTGDAGRAKTVPEIIERTREDIAAAMGFDPKKVSVRVEFGS